MVAAPWTSRTLPRGTLVGTRMCHSHCRTRRDRRRRRVERDTSDSLALGASNLLQSAAGRIDRHGHERTGHFRSSRSGMRQALRRTLRAKIRRTGTCPARTIRAHCSCIRSRRARQHKHPLSTRKSKCIFPPGSGHFRSSLRRREASGAEQQMRYCPSHRDC